MSDPLHPLVGALRPEFLEELRKQLWRFWRQFRSVGVEFEDLVQEVLVRLIESPVTRGDSTADKYRERLLARGSVIAKHHLIDRARRKQLLTNIDLSGVTEGDGGKSADVDGAAAQESLDHFWRGVQREVERVGPPPPREFGAAWVDLRRQDKAVSENQVLLWAEQFRTGRATVYRWKRAIESAVKLGLGYADRRAQA